MAPRRGPCRIEARGEPCGPPRSAFARNARVEVLVHRVERLEALTKGRARRALFMAAAGTAATAVTVALVCLSLGGRLCAMPPKSIATSAATFGAVGAISEDGRPMTVYVRP
jgi:hypothetical protein